MTIQEEIPQQNPFEDQRKQALELYEKMVKECHHCSSFIQRAIESYNPDLQAQLSAKEQEITDLKTCVDNFSDMYQEKCTELASVRADYDDQSLKVKRQADHIEVLRAENERLKKALDAMDKRRVEIGGERNDLRKRCEDLEALNYEFQDTLKSILDTSEMVPSIREEAEKLLNGNQIKS